VSHCFLFCGGVPVDVLRALQFDAGAGILNILCCANEVIEHESIDSALSYLCLPPTYNSVCCFVQVVFGCLGAVATFVVALLTAVNSGVVCCASGCFCVVVVVGSGCAGDFDVSSLLVSMLLLHDVGVVESSVDDVDSGDVDNGDVDSGDVDGGDDDEGCVGDSSSEGGIVVGSVGRVVFLGGGGGKGLDGGTEGVRGDDDGVGDEDEDEVP